MSTDSTMLDIQFCMFYVKYIHYFELDVGVNQRVQTHADREKYLELHRQLFPKTLDYLIARGVHGEALEKFKSEWYNPIMEVLFPNSNED